MDYDKLHDKIVSLMPKFEVEKFDLNKLEFKGNQLTYQDSVIGELENDRFYVIEYLNHRMSETDVREVNYSAYIFRDTWEDVKHLATSALNVKIEGGTLEHDKIVTENWEVFRHGQRVPISFMTETLLEALEQQCLYPARCDYESCTEKGNCPECTSYLKDEFRIIPDRHY